MYIINDRWRQDLRCWIFASRAIVLRARISVESLLKVYDVVTEVPLILKGFFFYHDSKFCPTVVLPSLMPACSFASSSSAVVLMLLYATFTVTLPGFADKVYGLCSLWLFAVSFGWWGMTNDFVHSLSHSICFQTPWHRTARAFVVSSRPCWNIVNARRLSSLQTVVLPTSSSSRSSSS